MEGNDDPRTIWIIFQQFDACRKMEATENTLGIKVDENVTMNEQVIFDLFNEFFVNVASI